MQNLILSSLRSSPTHLGRVQAVLCTRCHIISFSSEKEELSMPGILYTIMNHREDKVTPDGNTEMQHQIFSVTGDL